MTEWTKNLCREAVISYLASHPDRIDTFEQEKAKDCSSSERFTIIFSGGCIGGAVLQYIVDLVNNTPDTSVWWLALAGPLVYFLGRRLIKRTEEEVQDLIIEARRRSQT